MNITTDVIKEKIKIMYPEIDKHKIIMSVDFDAAKDAFIVKFTRDKHELTTHLDKKDAKECMDDIKCVHLGSQIGQFIKNFETI